MADTTNVQPGQETALAVPEVGHAASQLVPFNLDPKRGRVSFWSSLVPTGAKEKARLYNAMTGVANSIDSVIGDEILVEHVVYQGIDITDPVSGELRPAVRTVLITPQGKTYACVSEGIRADLAKLQGVFGELPWIDGLAVVPVQIKTRAGRRVYGLRVPTEAEGRSEPQPQPQPQPQPKGTAAKK